MPSSIYTEKLFGGTTFEMILVEGGSFLMGSQDDEAVDREKPVHEVSLQGFYMGKYPVTQELWKAVMSADANPSRFKNDNRPVERVSWNDTQDFIQILNELTGHAYRLPTEAEWEYAARGGNRSDGYKYAGSNKLRDIGWYVGNSHGETKPVGLKYPNELGLYDMSGNVWEWVEDQWHDNYQGAPVDGSAWVDKGEGMSRILRGGSWGSDSRICRCTYRYVSPPEDRLTFGFRLVLPVQSGG